MRCKTTTYLDKININNFDFLRVLFAFTVAIAHFIDLSQIEVFKPYSPFFDSRLAIDGFFIISGFLIAKSYQNSEGLKNYIIKRIKRIFPAYMLVVCFCALFFSFISTNTIDNYFLDKQFWQYLAANLSFQNYAQPCLPGVFEINKICAVNGALWTIKIEEAFYLLLPVFYWLVNSKKINIYFLTILSYVISIIYYNYFLAIDMYRIGKQLPGAISLFVTGIILFNNFSFFLKHKNLMIIPAVFLFFAEYFILNTHILKPFSLGIIIFYIAYSFKFLNHFGKYGDITYGIYIFHFPIIQLFYYLGFYDSYDPFLSSGLTLGIIIIIAYFSWHYIELPYLSKSRKLRQKKLFYNKQPKV